MSKFSSLLNIVFLCQSILAFAQRPSTNYGAIDIQNYEFHIKVYDDSNNIEIKANIDILFSSTSSEFILDLENIDESKKGMTVEAVSLDGKLVNYKHENNSLIIIYSGFESGTTKTLSITYHGTPKDGLVISKNKYGDRTFFGDNWPNRARQWLPTVDHPSDKAFVTWHVTAPSHYQVIGNGYQVEETDLSDQNTLYVWKSNVPIPTKVMVIGIARFAVQYIGETHNIPISSWVYPQNKDAGFYDYALAKSVINYFIENVGPYPFAKLANVQSKTRFGGMENASNIFYFENSVSGERKIESLIAHEIAHQWFGNSASESDWTHLWLSEGFATYFTNLYVEQIKGNAEFKALLNKQRETIIAFSKKQLTPVLDTKTESLMRLLNANSYQKGGWVLHMLRKKVGDDLFWQAIKEYYKTYALKNASTSDLKAIFESITQQNLDVFFQQWLEKPGHPILKSTWKSTQNNLQLSIKQIQKTDVVFDFPLEINLIYEDGSSALKTVQIEQSASQFNLETPSKVKTIELDPNSWLLFENH